VARPGTLAGRAWAHPVDRHDGDVDGRRACVGPRPAAAGPRQPRPDRGRRRLRLLPPRALRAAVVRVLGPRCVRTGLAVAAYVAGAAARRRPPPRVRPRPRDPRPAAFAPVLTLAAAALSARPVPSLGAAPRAVDHRGRCRLVAAA